MPKVFKFASLGMLTLVAGLLAGCAGSTMAPPATVYDPDEANNRKTHAFNIAVDKAILRPVSTGYVKVIPDEATELVGNFADNLGLPNVVLNKLLQGDLEGAGMNTIRFAVNTVLGFGGFVDAMGAFGGEKDETDFGETLHVWGAPEGAYVELPFFGPSTDRDTAGMFVDFLIDPLGQLVPRKIARFATPAKIVSKVGNRGRYATTVDSLLYESADSYSQAQLFYLQNRRFELGQEAPVTEVDPFALDTEGF